MSLTRELLAADYSDVFKCDKPEGALFSPDDLQVAFWTHMPGWVNALMKLRNVIVKPFGLHTDKPAYARIEAGIRSGDAVGFFSVTAKNSNETVILLKDKHLNAWMSAMLDKDSVYCITVVKYNKWLGRAYFFFIKPFHKIIVRSMLASTVSRLAQEQKGK